jgi:hypothetical protein
MKTLILALFSAAALTLAAPAQAPRPAPPKAKWLAGTWSGKVDVAVKQTTDGRTTEKAVRIDFKFEFDEEGRPVMDLERGKKTTLAEVGQVKKVLSGKSVTTYTVKGLELSEKGCKLKLASATDRFTRTDGSSESFTSAATNDWSFVKEGDGLRIKLVTRSASTTAIRVLGSTSSSKGEGEAVIEGLLKK